MNLYTLEVKGRELASAGRWKIIVAAMVMQICFGAIYSWGVFVKPLMMECGWEKTQTSLAFTIFLMGYAGSMIFGGRWQDKAGPRKVALVGGFCLSLGYILAGFTQSLPWLYLTYGLLGGIGVGLGYICPVSVCTKWFPDRKGLATGLAVAGFGAGSLIFSPLAAKIITVWGWRSAFFTMGVSFLLLITAAAMFLKNPPGSLIQGSKEDFSPNYDMDWQEMVKTKKFWLLWIMFNFGATGGLMVIGHLPVYAGERGISTTSAALILGVLAAFNGVGRILWGIISDRFGRVKSLTLIFTLLTLVMVLLPGSRSYTALLLAAIYTGLSFGGIISVFPAITAEYYGYRNQGINYGLMFTAYGIAGITGPILGALTFDLLADYTPAFLGAALLSAVAAVMAWRTARTNNSFGKVGN